MNLLSGASIISLVLSSSHISLPSQMFLEAVQNSVIAKSPVVLPSEFFENLPFLRRNPEVPPEEFNEDICRSVPSGVGIPGFKPGIHKNDIMQMFGAPTGTLIGYWPNTNAVYYELIPNQISLGFLFDKKSGLLRQTEAAFAKDVDSQVMEATVNGMLGCRINETIKQGLQQVYLQQSRRYLFSIDALKGVIEVDKSDRIYVGVWQADLH